MMSSSTEMSAIPMLIPARSGMAWSWNGLPVRLANAVRALASVLIRMPNQATA